MTTEISSSLTAAGLGVSTAVSIGGDAIIGSTYAELMPLFEADEQTEAIVIYTEPGGRMEAELVDWREENDSRLPIVAFMAGKFMDDEEMQGMSFGHAGTIVEGEEDSATEKIARLEAAGIPVVERIDEIPDAVKEKLGTMRGCASPSRHLHRRRGRRRRSPTIAELAAKLEEVCPVDIFTATRRRASRSSTRTSTSACSASSASRPRPPAPSASRSSTTAPSLPRRADAAVPLTRSVATRGRPSRCGTRRSPGRQRLRCARLRDRTVAAGAFAQPDELASRRRTPKRRAAGPTSQPEALATPVGLEGSR